MRLTRVFFVALAITFAMASAVLFGPPPTAQAAISTAPSLAVEDGDIYGFFILKGRVPVGFRDIDHLNLGGSGDFGAGATPPYYGQIRLKTRGRTDFKLNKPELDGKHFSFTTKAVRGVSYAFDGTLSRTNFESPAPPNDTEVVLWGTLKKMQGGRVIAEAEVKFTWFVGD